jgi:hypothetical protein
VKTESYSNTSSEIEDRMLNAYGGYLRTRTVGNIHYIDWVKQYGNENAQPIEFSVNLLDLTDKLDAGGVFTALIPLGASEIGEDGEYTDPVSIASVNGGLNYIQDDEAVAKYGKIWRTYTWSYEDDPAKLLEKAREYLKTGIAVETLTLKAVDMHFVDGNVQPIRIGDRVRIRSNPHGLDRVMVCSQIEIDLLNPENTLYTFGEKPRTLTENFVRAEVEVEELTGYRGGGGGGRKNVLEEVSDIIRWADYIFDDQNAHINFNAGELDKTKERLSTAEIDIDGLKAEILLKATRIEVNELEGRVDKAEASIKINADEIEMKVSKDDVISSINQTAEEIRIQAKHINLDGYVTSSMLNAELVSLNNAFADSFGTFDLSATNISCATLKVDGSSAQWYTSPSFVTKVSLNGTSSFAVKDTNGITHTIYAGYTIGTDKDTISYLG